MGAPIRSQTEIDQIVTRGQHTIADLSNDLVAEEKRGIDSTDRDHRDKMYRLILLCAYFANLLNPDGDIKNYYLDAGNEKKLNNILDGIVKLSRIFDGPAIPRLGSINQPLLFFPATGGSTPAPTPDSLARFSSTVNSPNGIVDSFNVAIAQEFAVWYYNARGSNPGEGSRAGMIVADWRDSASADWYELPASDVGGITSPLTFSVSISSGVVQLVATVATNNWSIKGVRII